MQLFFLDGSCKFSGRENFVDVCGTIDGDCGMHCLAGVGRYRFSRIRVRDDGGLTSLTVRVLFDFYVRDTRSKRQGWTGDD